MSWGQRFKRLVQAPRPQPDDARSRFGGEGERAVQAALAEAFPHVFFNRLLPHPKRAGWTLEADALIYAGGVVFALELKSYRGVLAFARDGRTLVKARHGEVETLGDPLNQAQFFLEQLPRTVPGLRRARLVPAAVFRDDPALDLSAVHSLAAGYLWASEVEAFVSRHVGAPVVPAAAAATGEARGFWVWLGRWWRRWRGGAGATGAEVPTDRPAPGTGTAAGSARRGPRGTGRAEADPAVVAALAALPTWDVVVTADGTAHRGVLAGPSLALLDARGRPVAVPLADLRRVDIARAGRWGRDRVTAELAAGGTAHYRNLTGEVRLTQPDGERIFWLRDVAAIAIGAQCLAQRR